MHPVPILTRAEAGASREGGSIIGP
jgi:hypothetical protein